MENTAIKAGLPHLGPTTAPLSPQKKPVSAALRLLKILASLRITVVLFGFSILLVFFGTLAQVDAGIWTVVSQYFRSAYVWVPLQIFFPRDLSIPGGFPFPGGWLLGGLLLVNLLAAHAIRFHLTWKRSGILLIHAGLIVMMVSEVVTGVFAVESRMVIANGETVGFIDSTREVELAILDSSRAKVDDVVVIPERLLRTPGLIQDPLLPFAMEIQEYSANSALVVVPPGKNARIASDGNYHSVIPQPEGAGVEANQREDVPLVRVLFFKKGTREKLADGLFSLWYYANNTTLRFQPYHVMVDGKPLQIELRFKRTYLPFSLHLLEFRHDIYLGTKTPKNFSSRVRLRDPERKEDRELTISMNAPLRYDGETFYQSSFLPGDRGTILQVVRNPGWLMPYVSCAMVALGMLIHFGLHLVKFLQQRMAL